MTPGPPLPLWTPGAGGEGAGRVLLTQLRPDSDRVTPAMLVFAGGGYVNRAEHEGPQVARWLAGSGISAFVLDYRVSPIRHPYPLADAKRGIRRLRSNAAEYGIDPHRIGAIGFSAGGHLAATLATRWDAADEVADDLKETDCRPDLLVLCYPVISFIRHVQVDSMHNLLGKGPPARLRERLSAELRVTARTPPTFLWHGADDPVVPVQNSLLFAQALADHGVPHELHIYARGACHGVGLAAGIPRVEEWPRLCREWIQENFMR